MRKLVYLTLIGSIVISLAACTMAKPESVKGVIKPGDNIGEMTVEQSSEIPYPNFWWFCEFSDEYEPNINTSDCEVPLVSSLDINIGWIAKESKLAPNWDAMTWEIYIDGYRIDLESFKWLEEEYTAKVENNKARDWELTLKNLTPGEHTLRITRTSEIAVDDGWNEYQPGRYEEIVNFTVLEEKVYPTFSSSVDIGQHPYTSENAEIDFLLYLPDDYGKDPQQEWPMIVFLHGALLRGSNLELLLGAELPKKLEKEKDFPFIVVSPLGDGGQGFWSKEMINPLFTLLEEIQTEYSVDPKRIYLTGNTIGAYGVWAIGLRYPEYFAALAPVSGYFGWPHGVPDNICDLKDVPVWAFHGSRDDTIPVEADQELVDALNACGGNAQITINTDMKMDLRIKVYNDPELYQWLLTQKLK
jgi:hypothetical protein